MSVRHPLLRVFCLVLVFCGVSAHAANDTWEGGGPFAAGAGNRVINALAVGPDGFTVYAGTGSGTVFRYIQSNTAPAAFSFAAQTGVEPGAEAISNAITVAGINAPAPISLVACGSGDCAYSIDDGAWIASPGMVENGKSVRVRQTAASGYSTESVLTLDIGGVNSDFSVTTTPAPQAGVCGSAAATPTLLAPTTGLCAHGMADAVNSENGLHRWNCAGGNGGADAQCVAPGASIGGGSVTLVLDAGTCQIESARLVIPPAGGPTGVTMPFGALEFAASSCGLNGSVTVRTSYSASLANMAYWKYLGDVWTPMLPGLTGNTVQFSIADNGPFDADPASGRIVDPGGPGISAVTGADDPVPIPSLSPWSVVLLSMALAALALRTHFRRR